MCRVGRSRSGRSYPRRSRSRWSDRHPARTARLHPECDGVVPKPPGNSRCAPGSMTTVRTRWIESASANVRRQVTNGGSRRSQGSRISAVLRSQRTTPWWGRRLTLCTVWVDPIVRPAHPRTQQDEPLRTVICVVGEFKQGKSALVDALCGDAICPFMTMSPRRCRRGSMPPQSRRLVCAWSMGMSTSWK